MDLIDFGLSEKLILKVFLLRRRRKKRYFKGDFENLGSRSTLILFVKVEKKGLFWGPFLGVTKSEVKHSFLI